MADNVVANPGTGGATFATDDIGGVQYPRSKVVWGPDGTANDADVASGKPLPVQLRAADGTAASQNSGNKDGGTLRVVLATDQPALSTPMPADTELPAATALADAASNPTSPIVGAALLVWNGASWDRLRAANIHKDLNAAAIGTIATVWTPAGGKKVRLMGGMISVSAAVSVLFEDNGAGTTVCRTPKLLADTPYNFDLGQGVLLAAANNVLKATSSAAANITGTLYGVEE